MNYNYQVNYQPYYEPTPPPPPVKKKSKKWIPFAIIGGYKLLVIIAVIIVISFVSTVIYSQGSGTVGTYLGKTYLSIQTDSMYPTLSSGDLAVGKANFETEDLKVGDIITYWTVIDGERVLNTHRIYEIYDGGDYRIFATKGDNNSAVDSLTVHESEVVSVYQTSIPGAGETMDYLSTSTGFFVLIIICLLAIVF